MNNKELITLRKFLILGNDSNDWGSIEEAIEYLNEFIEFDEESE